MLLLSIESVNDFRVNHEIEDIANSYYKSLYAYCFRILKNDYDVTAVIGDAFVLLLEKWDSVDKNHVCGWLLRTTRNLIYKLYREKKKDLILVDIEYYENSLELSEDTIDIEFRNKVADEMIDENKNKIIDSLNNPDKELFQEYFVRKEPYEELAKKNNVSENAIRVRIMRLRRKIRNKVEMIAKTEF